jgi:hypothetical protein
MSKAFLIVGVLTWAGLCGSAAAAGISVSVGGASVGASIGADVGSGGTGTTVTGPSGSLGLGGGMSDDATGNGSSDQQNALEAVRSARVLSLDKILAAAKPYADGEVIDAKLVSVRGFLLYDLKVLGPKGDVGDLYLYALSGKLVASQ